MKPLKSCAGGSAEGNRCFFMREKIIRKIRRKLANKENLLISAPRRIGKTSLLKHLRDTPEENQIIIYLIVQSVASVDEFNKRLFDELTKDQQIYGWFERSRKQINAGIKRQASRVQSISLEGGIKINPNENIDYYAERNALLDEPQQHDKQIILFIDEFPDVLTNIDKEDKKANRNDAITLLQQQREIREKYKNGHIQFAYTGSTGLKNVVRKLGDIHLVNNLNEIKVPPFTRQEAAELMQRLILGKQEDLEDFNISDEVIEYTVDKIQWPLPLPPITFY
ncbi:MAG: ATP-binding protein [Candidatus Electrothrix sp. GM3_4]|nr:ATP-binding protein [Candidatus Electrothrix sp. GM3_4]